MKINYHLNLKCIYMPFKNLYLLVIKGDTTRKSLKTNTLLTKQPQAIDFFKDFKLKLKKNFLWR